MFLPTFVFLSTLLFSVTTASPLRQTHYELAGRATSTSAQQTSFVANLVDLYDQGSTATPIYTADGSACPVEIAANGGYLQSGELYGIGNGVEHAALSGTINSYGNKCSFSLAIWGTVPDNTWIGNLNCGSKYSWGCYQVNEAYSGSSCDSDLNGLTTFIVCNA